MFFQQEGEGNKMRRNMLCWMLAVALVLPAVVNAEKADGESKNVIQKEVQVDPAQTNAASGDENTPNIRLWVWHGMMHVNYDIRVLAFLPLENPARTFYMWFFEHTLFDGIEKGETQFHGPLLPEGTAGPDGNHATIVCRTVEKRQRQVQLTSTATRDGADLEIQITNTTDYTWPEIAGIIPCFFPGSFTPKKTGPPLCPEFTDLERQRTFFVGADGLDLLENRDIHFNHAFRPQIKEISPNDEFVFTVKWPTSKKDAYAGLMVREDADGDWVAGIAWDDFISAQGHNPLKCMHLGARVGPLKPGETKTIRGKVYLFKGSKEECLKRFKEDFNIAED